MDRSRGVAFCGLACCVCGHDDNCPGCRNEGCSGKDWCANFKCCREKGCSGCWECPNFPCAAGMFEKPRVRVFAKFIKEHGEEELMRCLERNERSGVVYHYKGQLAGDYDKAATEEDMVYFIRNGKLPENG